MIKQGNFDEIVKTEASLALAAPERFGAFYENAVRFNLLLGSGIKSVKSDRYVFAAFLSIIRKHHALALLSAVRLHHVQTMMNLRQVLEAGSCAAYAIANTDEADFVKIDEDGLLDPSKDLTNKRYKWLNEKYPAGSRSIKGMKDHINSVSAHANLVDAASVFNYDDKSNQFLTPMFDDENEFVITSDIWLTANIARGVLDLLYRVNRDTNGFSFVPEFERQFEELAKQNDALREQAIASERLKQTERSCSIIPASPLCRHLQPTSRGETRE